MMTGGAGKKRERRENDFYPTPWEGTAALIAAEHQALKIGRIWEPACGDGAMATALIDAGCSVTHATDLINRGYGTAGVDFLRASLPAGITSIVTNPPFALAAAFIRHALDDLQVPYLALLLKATYWHAGERVGLHRRHRPTATLPLAFRLDFTGEKNSTMDLTWFVWDAAKAGTHREDILEKPLRTAPALADLFEAAE